jgi:hypothetical protein
MKADGFDAPVVTAAIVGLVVLALVFWGYGSGGPSGVHTASFRHTRAKLADGNTCVFTADIQLDNTFSQWTFARNRLDIRSALVSLVGTKSRYMVETEVEREALSEQMADEVNRIVDKKIATRVALPEFELF